MANLPMREVNRVQMVFRVFLHVILRMSVAMLRLLINKFSLAIVGALVVVGAIVAAMSMAPPPRSVTGQVQQHSMEELTVQFETAPLPLSLPLLHVSSYDIQWTSVGTGESWTAQGEITISGVTEGTEAVSYTVKGLDPERVYRFRTRGRNLLGAGPWSDWFRPTGSSRGLGPRQRLSRPPRQRQHPLRRPRRTPSISTRTSVLPSVRKSQPSCRSQRMPTPTSVTGSGRVPRLRSATGKISITLTPKTLPPTRRRVRTSDLS